MKAYVLAIAGMAMLTAVVTLVMPRKKFSGTIGGILKLCMILTLVGPILGFIRQDPTEFSSADSISGNEALVRLLSYSWTDCPVQR